MIIIISCPICNQLLELDHKITSENKLLSEEDYNPKTLTSIPCNHLYKYSDGIFYQHSFIVKVDDKGIVTPTPFFGEKICKTKPLLYNTYLRPTVPIQELYRKVETLNDELGYFKEKTLSLQSEIGLDEHVSNKTELVINPDEIRQMLEHEHLKDNNQLLEKDYVNMVLTSQSSMLELEELKERIKNIKNPSQELQIQFGILKKQYCDLKEDFVHLEEKNHQLYQQLLNVQINSVVELSQGYRNQEKEDEDISYSVFNDPSNEIQIQMLQNELLITTEQKNVYEGEINRLSDILTKNEKIIQVLTSDNQSTSELKTRNFHLDENMKSFGKEIEQLIKNIGEESVKKVILRYLTVLRDRITNVEDLYLTFVSQIKEQMDQHRKVLNLPKISTDHKALIIPKLEIKKMHNDVEKLLENMDNNIEKTVLVESRTTKNKNPRPDPDEFYMRVINDEWKYSIDDQLIFMKALFKLESFMMDTAKELTVDEQLREFMKFFKNLKETANKTITALNNLVTKNEKEFARVPPFMQDYILKYVGKISELDLEKEVYTNEELTLLSYSLMISDIPIMEEGTERNEEMETTSTKDSKKKQSMRKISKSRQSGKKNVTGRNPDKKKLKKKNQTNKFLGLDDLEISDLI